MTTSLDPFDCLLNIEKKIEQSHHTFPQIRQYNYNGLVFSIDNCQFIIDHEDVSEVCAMTIITPLPNVQSWIIGLMNIRGRIIPIIDLNLFLGNNKKPYNNDCRIILIEKFYIIVGLIVDTIQDMVQYSVLSETLDKSYLALPNTIRKIGSRLITGRCATNRKQFIFSAKQLVTDAYFLQAATEIH